MEQIFVNYIFDRYIQIFEKINGKSNREYFKWEAAYEAGTFDFNSPENFADRLDHLRKTTSVLIDAGVIPFSTICSLAKKNAEYSERIRLAFLRLFQDYNGSLTQLQDQIDTFCSDMEELRKENGISGYMGEMNQTAAMGFLAIRNPEQNYILRKSEAEKLAKFVGAEVDFGTLKNFRLENYYQFCDEIIAAMRAYQPLLDTDALRYLPEFAEGDHLPFYDDKCYHILLIDIFHAVDKYGLLPASEAAEMETFKKSYREYTEAYDEYQKLQGAEAFAADVYKIGNRLTYTDIRSGKAQKEVIVEELAGTDYVMFSGLTGKRDKYTLLTGKIVRSDAPDFSENLEKYKDFLIRRKNIIRRFESAKKGMA